MRCCQAPSSRGVRGRHLGHVLFADRKVAVRRVRQIEGTLARDVVRAGVVALDDDRGVVVLPDGGTVSPVDVDFDGGGHGGILPWGEGKKGGDRRLFPMRKVRSSRSPKWVVQGMLRPRGTNQQAQANCGPEGLIK